MGNEGDVRFFLFPLLNPHFHWPRRPSIHVSFRHGVIGGTSRWAEVLFDGLGAGLVGTVCLFSPVWIRKFSMERSRFWDGTLVHWFLDSHPGQQLDPPVRGTGYVYRFKASPGVFTFGERPIG